MGLCREGKGHVSVESRRESFYVHWGLDLDNDEDQRRPDLAAVEKFFTEVPHPEFPYEDLDDLIAVLVDLRDDDKQYQKWQREHPVEDCPVCGGTCGREGCHFC